LYTGCLTRSWI